MKKLITMLMLLMAGWQATAQKPQVLFYGYIEEGRFEDQDAARKKKREKPPEKLKGVQIFVYNEADSLLNIVDARETGFYALLLDAGAKYHVTFEKTNYFCKCFELDCKKAEYSTSEGAIKCLTDVSLFKKIDNDDLLSLCRVPYARCSYDRGEMQWDMPYTERAKEKFYEMAQPYYMAAGK